MAATSRIINVTSCSASHTNCKKVLGFLGGIKFCPNTVFRFSMSAGCPLRPARERQTKREKKFLWAYFFFLGIHQKKNHKYASIDYLKSAEFHNSQDGSESVTKVRVMCIQSIWRNILEETMPSDGDPHSADLSNISTSFRHSRQCESWGQV